MMATDTAQPLVVRDVGFSYEKHRVLRGIDLVIDTGQVVAIMGPSGSGKSTLLSIVLGLLKPDSGSVCVAGHQVRAGMRGATARLRRSTIGMVFQAGYLLDELTPAENVMLPALINGASPQVASERATALLDLLGIDGYERPTSSLSGGEQQRVAIARALINEPVLLIADEPTAALDSDNRANVMQSLVDQVRGAERGLLIVTHDEVVAGYADRQFYLSEGVLNEVVA